MHFIKLHINKEKQEDKNKSSESMETRDLLLEKPRWLPDFCSAPVLFAVMLVAELVVLVIMIAPSKDMSAFLPRLATMTVFVQWLALLCAISLCKLKILLERMKPALAVFLAYLLTMVITGLGSAVVFLIDQSLGLQLTLPADFQQRFIIGNMTICALISAALLRYFYVLERWRERVRAAAKAQFEALQARIRPHFLFNSMNTIASLIRTRPKEAEHAVEDMCDLFRAALGSHSNGLSTLGVDLELARRYLGIEQLRLGKRLQIHWEVQEIPTGLRLPALLLQPLVENAVYHGIQQLSEGGTVEVVAQTRDSFVELTIRNPRPVSAQLSHQGNGMALANIRHRIEYYFGSRGTLDVSIEKGYFSCVVRLPVNFEIRH